MSKAAKFLKLGVFVMPCIFASSRIAYFIIYMTSIRFALPLCVCFFLLLALCIVFSRKIFDFLRENAYGARQEAVLIYVLAIFVAWKYKGAFIFEVTPVLDVFNILGAGIIFGFFVLLLMRCVIYIVENSGFLKPTKIDAVFLIVLLAALCVEGVIYCMGIKKIFVWDNAGYFKTVLSLNEIFPSAEYFRQMYNSVFTLDYNYVIIFFSSLMCKIFGSSRMVFVLSILIFGVFSFYMILHLGSKKLFSGSVVHTLLVVFLLPYAIFAANTGFVDILGCVPALAACLIFFSYEKDETAVLSGTLLALSVFMRRWYSFYALSFIITAVICAIFHKKYKKAIYVFLGFAFTLMFFAQRFVMEKLMADYGNMYSAYNLGIKTDYFLTVRYFGIIPLAVMAAYSVYTCFKKKEFTVELFLLLQMAICFALFVSVQTHGQQHLALYLPSAALIARSMISSVKKKTVFAAAAVICVFATVNTYIVRVQPTSVGEIKTHALFPDYSAYPPRDESAEEILSVTEYMDSEIGEKGKTCCLLSSSLALNYDTLSNAEISLSVKKKSEVDRDSYFLTIAEIDSRDELSDNLFNADYILFPGTLQLHLAEEEQEVIAVPYRFITENTGFGKAYEREETVFRLSNGIDIFIYRRTRDVTDYEISEIAALIS